MQYREFISEILELAAKNLGEGGEVTVRKVRKNNGVFIDCLVVRLPKRGLSPSFHLDRCYENYLSGESVSEIAAQIAECCRQSRGMTEDDLDYLYDFTRIRPRLTARLVNTEKNLDIMEDVPHLDILNLSVIYYCLLDGTADSEGGFMIRNSLMEAWGVPEEDIHRAAIENMAAVNPVRFRSIQDIMNEILQSGESAADGESKIRAQDDDVPLYVLSNRRKLFGAVWIADKDVQKKIGMKIQDDYYVLPSSVHECLVLPAGSGPDEKALLGMVTDINRTQVGEEEFLADAVYRYDRASSKLLLAAGG